MSAIKKKLSRSNGSSNHTKCQAEEAEARGAKWRGWHAR